MKRFTLAALSLFLCGTLAFAQARPRITGIAQVRVFTESPAASQAFYGDLIGLNHTSTSTSSIYTVNDLQTIDVEPLPVSAPQSRLAAVVLRTTDAAALAKYLQAHAIQITEPLQNGTFGVHDPEGNLILFTQARTPTTASPKATARRIIHAGFSVHNRDAEDHFYRDLLGFHVYWYGGQKDGQLDYVAMQVPDGSDWVEYMLTVPANADARQLGGANHMSLGLAKMDDAVAGLHRNGCQGDACGKTQLGRDGKTQLNLFDPDHTRVEYMEFTPVSTPCCSAFTGKTPSEKEDR